MSRKRNRNGILHFSIKEYAIYTTGAPLVYLFIRKILRLMKVDVLHSVPEELLDNYVIRFM